MDQLTVDVEQLGEAKRVSVTFTPVVVESELDADEAEAVSDYLANRL